MIVTSDDVLLRSQHAIKDHLNLPLHLKLDQNRDITTKALIDSGAMANFIHHRMVRKYGLQCTTLRTPITVRNADNTYNRIGKITHKVVTKMMVDNQTQTVHFLVSHIGEDDFILGYPWLATNNPNIDWKNSNIHFNQQKVSPFKRVVLALHTKVKTALKVQNARRSLPHSILAITRSKDGYCHITRRLTQSTELPAAENVKKAQRTLEELVPSVYMDYRQVFEEAASQKLPPRSKWDHEIKLKPGTTAENNCKIYPLNPAEQISLDAFLDDMLTCGYIRPSQSPFASPFFFIKKKDGKLCPVQDYRQLNDLTVKNQYPLPLISDITDNLKNAKIFSKFDVRWWYNNVRIKDGDEWKAAFKTNRGMFEPLVMFFGLCNSPATFQAMINDTFKDLIATGKVFIYMDDILIATATLKEHRQLVSQVLQRLQDHNLFLKPEKCEFEQSEIEYLGVRLRANTIAMDPVKLGGIADWPTPQKLKDVRGFLGFTGFYRRFIRNYSAIARPLNDLTKKDTPWSWTSLAQKAFQNLKDRFRDNLILEQPDTNKPFRLECDASKFAMGAVLSQRGLDGLWHMVASMSRSFNPAERNYDIYDRELLAIIKALKEWRHYLEGGLQPIEVLSDHKNLEIFRHAAKLSYRQARWAEFLTRFNFTIQHISGKKAGKPDALSRRPDHDMGDNDNEDRVLLDPSLFTSIKTLSIAFEDLHLLSQIKDCQVHDQEVLDVHCYLLATQMSPTKKALQKLWTVQDA